MPRICAFVLAFLIYPSICAADRSVDNIDGDCRNIVPAADVNVDGRTLRDAPDIVDPKLRQINALVTENCFAAASEALDLYEAEHPAEFRAAFVRARFLWIHTRAKDAKALLRASIDKHPDFTSGYLLLGSMALAEGDLATASKMLDVVDKQSPSSLWLFIDRLVLDARMAPSRQVAEQLIKVAKDSRFPGNVRQSAAQEVQRLGNKISAQEMDDILRTEISFESNLPLDQKMLMYAAWLIETQDRSEDGRRVLRSAKIDDEGIEHRRKTLLAESYLFDALKIDPVQTPRNIALVEKAKKELDGDLGPIVEASALDPNLSQLKGFFRAVEDVDTPDYSGETGLCLSMMAMILDVGYVNELLENLADPNQTCSDKNTTPLGMIVTRGDQTEKRVLILKELLRRGADPNPKVFNEDIKTFCDNQPGGCPGTLPILQAAWTTASSGK